MRSVVVMILLIHALAVRAEDRDSVQPLRLIMVGGITIGAITYGHAVVNDFWWKGEKVPFHVNTEQDYEYALNADKLGHLTFSYIGTTVYGSAFRWCGLDSVTSLWTGAGVTMAYQTYVEIRDGFSANYGFSWGDMAANTIGAALPLVQHYVPPLRSLDLQISYWPSDAYKSGAYNSIIDDYTSTTHWLSVNAQDIAPRAWKQWMPEWIGLALGHSVQNLDGQGGGQHVLYLSLDWQPHRIKGLPSWLAEALRLAHLYHLPAPAVRLLPDVVWYGLRF
jgi:hypothetical protein